MSATNSASGSKNNSMPTTITLSTFTAARIKEIQAMRKNIMESRSTKLAFQKLPKHMRRRTMSHVVKRLPRRLRQIHMNQMQKAGLPPKNNRGSRKYRRRPLNLQSEYARRQRRVKWLNTHLWHAKRFHMIEKWGYKLPKQPCDKSFRACYRATTQHCLVQDMSYVKCIELNGSYEDIMSQLEKMVDIRTGLTFKALCFREGKKFGELTLFEPAVNSYERKAIGQIKYLWNQYADGRKLLWLFVHAAFYKQMVTLFIKLFNFELLKENELKTITYKSPQGVILKELEYELDTISLTGSLAIDILKIALRTVELTEKHQDMLRNCTRKFLIKQNQVFDNLSKESHIPPNMVLSITVNDPRLNFPTKRTKALLNSCTPNDDDFDELQSNLSFSPLFDERVRNLIKTNRVSNEEICKLREKNLIPGSELELKNETLIPLILLWRPGNKEKENNGYSSGWDIIVPSNWSQTFFLAFVMWGARAGGLRETESIAFERSQPDILYPDTIAGEEEERDISQLYREKYFRSSLPLKHPNQ
ncbi:hypothetical protein ABEB36_005722 [Hypothenemus hampei]|uniref:Uncharacterized protein n=1 Tax=Hypothenemus hampei TaxID=57062 RepID=A0ABD1EZL7_HYPHA